jgi:hypothetical protein
MAAGRKEDDNTFSGVIMGAWEQGTNGNEITDTTGLYGFHHGAMSYAFKDDGTAFIGKDGNGRIEFDGTQGIIESANYGENDKEGMQINLKEGTIKAHNFTLDVGNTTNKKDNSILITTDLNKNPLSIGSHFIVNWKGEITATGGYIGDWEIVEGTLQDNGGNIILDALNQSITGANIYTGALHGDGGTKSLIWLDGYLSIGAEINGKV